MRLVEEDLKCNLEWERAGYTLPKYNRHTVEERTKENPEWIHFGAGNIFRAFQANVVEKLLNTGDLDTGLIVAEGYDYEIISKINRPHDNYSILVTLKADSSVEKSIIGSVVESLFLDQKQEAEFSRLKEIFRKDSLKMVSFTITEKGYSIRNEKGIFYPNIEADMESGPDKADSYLGKVTALLYERFIWGEHPIALVSMDNCSHNGDLLRDAVFTYANCWEEKKLVKTGFLRYLKDSSKVAFPCSMIDKITPRPDLKIEKLLQKDGIEGMESIITTKNSYMAPFVNAEESQYLVIEDCFPNGRIHLESAGIIYTDRETVDKVEKMKVCTCLNPLHTALALFGCLLGYSRIYEEMKDEDLVRLIHRIGYQEGLPVVVDPGIINPKEFIDQVVQVRLPNPFIPDSPQRIATDTSQKLAIRFGETVKAYLASDRLDILQLRGISLVFAGWIRYLMGIDDMGQPFDLSPDPILDSICPCVGDISLGDTIDVHQRLANILSNERIFGVSLYKAGLGEMVEDYFQIMISHRGAVREVLSHFNV